MHPENSDGIIEKPVHERKMRDERPAERQKWRKQEKSKKTLTDPL